MFALLVFFVFQEVFAYKIDVSLVQFIMGILDYVAADVLKVDDRYTCTLYMYRSVACTVCTCMYKYLCDTI